MIRATSSAISDVFMRSGRHDGGSIIHFFSSTSQPTTLKVLATSAGFTSKPRILEMSCGSMLKIGGNFASPVNTVSTCWAELFCINNCTKRAEANSASDGSTPRSNLRDASEDNLCRREF